MTVMLLLGGGRKSLYIIKTNIVCSMHGWAKKVLNLIQMINIVENIFLKLKLIVLEIFRNSRKLCACALPFHCDCTAGYPGAFWYACYSAWTVGEVGGFGLVG